MPNDKRGRVRRSWSVIRCVKATVSGFTKIPLEIEAQPQTVDWTCFCDRQLTTDNRQLQGICPFDGHKEAQGQEASAKVPLTSPHDLF